MIFISELLREPCVRLVYEVSAYYRVKLNEIEDEDIEELSLHIDGIYSKNDDEWERIAVLTFSMCRCGGTYMFLKNVVLYEHAMDQKLFALRQEKEAVYYEGKEYWMYGLHNFGELLERFFLVMGRMNMPKTFDVDLEIIIRRLCIQSGRSFQHFLEWWRINLDEMGEEALVIDF